MQRFQQYASRLLRPLWQTLVQKDQAPAQASRGQTGRQKKWMAVTAIATWFTAFAATIAVSESQFHASSLAGICTAGSAFSAAAISIKPDTHDVPKHRRISCRSASATSCTDALDSAAILPTARFAHSERDVCTGFSTTADSKSAHGRVCSFHAGYSHSRSSQHSGWCHETTAGSLCTESLHYACIHRTNPQGAVEFKKHAESSPHRGQPFRKSGEEDCCSPEDDPTELGQLANLCHSGQTADPERSPDVSSSDPQCRARLAPISTGSPTATAIDLSDSATDVFHSASCRSLSRSCYEHGSRWSSSTTTLGSAHRCQSCHSWIFFFTCQWTLQSSQHSHAFRSISIPTAADAFWVFRHFTRYEPGTVGIGWICWISNAPACEPLFRNSSSSDEQSTWPKLRTSHVPSCTYSSKLLRRRYPSPARTSPNGSSTFFGEPAWQLEDSRTPGEPSPDFFDGNTSECNSGTQQHGSGQSTHCDRSSGSSWRDLTNDATSKISLWNSLYRTRATTSTSLVRTGQYHAWYLGQATGSRTSTRAAAHWRQSGDHTNPRSNSSSKKSANRVQIVLHSLATRTSSESSAICRGSCRAFRIDSKGSRRTSTCASYPSETPQPGQHHSGVLPRDASFGFTDKASQADCWKREGPEAHTESTCGGPFGAPSSRSLILGIDVDGPSSSMGEKVTDLNHGSFAIASHDAFHDRSMTVRLGFSEPIRLRLEPLLTPKSVMEKQFWSLRESVDSLFEAWPLEFLTCDLAAAAQILPDLSQELRCFFQDCRRWNGETVYQMHLFTDGSASDHTPAAWALVVVYECWDANAQKPIFLFRGFAGAVLQSFDSWVRHGPNVGEMLSDALSAELVGLVWALGWSVQDSTCIHVHFHYDSLAAGQGVFGLWNPPKGDSYELLVKSATSLRQILACRATCQGQHIKAHSGCPWNELADAVAKAIAKGVLPSVALPSCLPAFLHHALVEHAWTEVALKQTNDIRSCAEWPSIFKREGPPNPLTIDPYWLSPAQPEPVQTSPKELTVSLRIATANVLTLDVGPQVQQKAGKLSLGRIGFLKAHLNPLQLHLVGLQEARSAGQVTRHSQDWWVFQSGCTSNGTHGVELWASRCTPYGKDGAKSLYFQQHHFTTLAFHERFLLMEILAPALQVHVLCLHSPFAKSTAMSPQAFWTLIDDTLNNRRNQHWPLLVLGDFNSRLGSVQTSAVSSHQAEAEVGTLMHQFMLERDLCAPSTFAHCHVTDGPTWNVDSPSAARIDFVLIPLEWLPCVTSSAVHYDVDLMTENDHHLVSLSLQLRLRNALKLATKPPRPCPRKLADPMIVQEFLSEVAQLDEVPWTFGVGVHCEWLTQKLQALSRRFFMPTGPKPLQKHLSDATWTLVTTRHTLLRTIRKLDSLNIRLCKLLHVQAWANLFRHRSLSLAASDRSQLSDRSQVLLDLRFSVRLLKMDLIALRKQLQVPARQEIKCDRLKELKSIAVRFVNSASLSNPKQVHRSLKPLLGTHSRKAVHSARPLPAIRTSEGSLAQSREELATAWQDHFANIEGGRPVEASQLQTALIADSHAVLQAIAPPPLDLQAVPTLAQIEAVIRRSNFAKAPGPDNLPAAVFKLNPVMFARLLYPLYLKISLRCSEPLKFRGGEIIALAKKASSKYNCSDYRAIVLADQMGKYFHTLQRQKLLPAFADFKAPMQAGCLAKIGVDHVHLQLEALASWAASSHRCLCVLFLDVASAYYKAVRSFILGGDYSDESICRLFLQNRWSPDLLHEFLAALNEPSAFEQAQVSSHKTYQNKLSFQAAWFALRNLPGTLTQTSQGTRPGNPLADLLFAFLFSRVSKEVQAQMDLAGCLDQFPVRWFPGVPLSEEEQLNCAPGIGSWADDLYLACTVESAKTLLSTATTVSKIAIDVAASFGLFLNLGDDKTNLLLVPRGPGSFEFKRLLATEGRPELSVMTQSLGQVSVKIVKDYVHLGALFDGTSCRPEISRRFLLSSPLVKQLRRPVFGDPSLSLSLKSMLLQSYVLSRFLFGLSTWHFAVKKDYQLWFSKLVRLYSVLLPKHAKGPGFQSLDLLALTRQLHPALLLAKHRLALLSRMFDTGLAPLWSILQESQLWCHQVLADLQTVALWVPEFPGWQLDSTLEEALQPFGSNPKHLSNVVKLAESRFYAYLTLLHDLQQFRDAFLCLLRQSPATLRTPEHEVFEPLTHQCSQCGQHFASFHGLTSHLHKEHGVKNLSRRYAASNVCRHCLTAYDNRESLIHHLKHLQTGCLIQLVQTVEPLSPEAVQVLDAESAAEQKIRRTQMRSKTFRFPPQRVSGPPRPPLWRNLLTQALDSGLEQDPVSLSQWVHSVWTSLQSLDFDQFETVLLAQPCTALSLRSLIAYLDSQLQSLAPEPRIHLTLQLDAALSLWISVPVSPSVPVAPIAPSVLSWRSCVGGLDWQLLADIRVPQQIGIVGPRCPASQWLCSLSQPYDVVCQIQLQHTRDLAHVVAWHNIPRPVHRCTAVLVYLFSGRRRPGDFMEHAESLGREMGIDVSVLLVDLALSPEHDMMDQQRVDWLLGRLRQGEIAAVLAAPPCETWSRARGRNLENGQTGPRVLRDPSSPWCISGLTRPELQQLKVANHLMFTTLLVALTCLLSGVRFCMEHPAAPSDRRLVSIWHTWPVQLLLQHCSVTLHNVVQSDYGALYKKPTTLMNIWLPHFAADMCVWIAPTSAADIRQLVGRDSDGYSTRFAKEYPSALNKSLAFAFLSDYQRGLGHRAPTAEISSALSTFINTLNEAQMPAAAQELQPDYAKHNSTET